MGGGIKLKINLFAVRGVLRLPEEKRGLFVFYQGCGVVFEENKFTGG